LLRHWGADSKEQQLFMIIQPRIRGFVCVTAHPAGCAAHVQEQIDVVKARGPISDGPRNVLIIGASTGYGLATRIAAAFGCGSATLGVFYERPGEPNRPASAGWYNSAAFHRAAAKAGVPAYSVNGDAFSDEIKRETLDIIREKMGKIDMVIYSLASPRRTDPKTGVTYQSVLKPIGQPYSAKNLNTDRKVVEPVTVQPATPEEVAGTVKVMGGEDWELWMEALDRADLLAEGVSSIAFDYIGPRETWPVYRDGTIGTAKIDLARAAKRIDSMLKLHRASPSSPSTRRSSPSLQRHTRRAPLHQHPLQGDEGKGLARGLHRADGPHAAHTPLQRQRSRLR
jgi:enoyl-[acyl-carrier protein] reductase/trans-2-enoyl-CoA reductase (NAD+)